MKLSSHKILIIALAFSPLAAIAQKKSDSTFSTKKLDFYQDYTPEVKLAPKPKLTPSEPNINADIKQSFQYEVPERALHYNYNAINIKPLALKPIIEPKSFQNYAALAFGNKRTVYADLGLTYHEDGQYDVHLHAHHFSQKGGAIDNRQSSVTDVRIGGKYFLSQYIINGGMDFNRTGFTYYGYNHDDYPTFVKDDLLQAYNTLSLNASLDKFNVHERGIGFQPAIKAYFMGIKTGGMENGFSWDAPLTYQLEDGLELGFGIDGMLTGTRINNSTFGNSYIGFNPKLSYTTDKLYATLGVSPVATKGNGWSWLPKINFRYALGTPTRAAVSAGWDGEVLMYTYKNLSDKNPFVFNPNMDNAIHRRIYGGLELALISNFKIEIKATYHTFSKYASFYNDYAVHTAGNKFNVNYVNDASLFELYAGAHILLANKFDLGANFTFNTFSETMMENILQEPRFNMNAYMKVKPVQALTVGANLQMLSGINYRNIHNDINTIPVAFNLGLSGQYDFLKRYSVFINLDNLLDSKYQRWNQYQVYGFNIFGGLKVKF